MLYTEIEHFLSKQFSTFRVPDFKSEVKLTIQRIIFPTYWISSFSDISSPNNSFETNDCSRRHRSSDIVATNKKMSFELQRTRSAPNMRH